MYSAILHIVSNVLFVLFSAPCHDVQAAGSVSGSTRARRPGREVHRVIWPA